MNLEQRVKERRCEKMKEMYETTYDKVTDQLWKMCDIYGEEQILEWLIELIEFRRGKEVLENLRRR